MAQPKTPPAGFYSDETGRRRWWDGADWTNHFVDPGTVALGGQLSAAERHAILERAVARYVRNGYRVQSDTGSQAVLAKRQRVNVLLNVLLTVVTGGIWLIFLAVRLLNWPTDRAVLTVDGAGELTGEFSS